MFEYFTTGGGWFLFNFFNAVAAITQTDQFQFLLTSGMLISASWITLMLAFEPQKWSMARNWGVGAVMVVSGLLVPTATVKVTDNINRIDSSGYIVQNVPWGLAFFASITSQAGNELTRLFDNNFTDVDAPDLQGHGFLFGVRLLAETTRVQIKDDHFRKSMSSFVRNCVFYDILQGRKSLIGLKEAGNPWAYITADPSVARMFEIETAGDGESWGSAIATCSDGVAMLNTRWAAETAEAERRLTQTVSPNRGNVAEAAIRAQVLSELPVFHQFLIGSSRQSADLLQRQMVINAIFQESANWMTEQGREGAITNYINTRLDQQTITSYNSIFQQAGKWVPALKAVFQALYIGIFPIAVVLMVTPMGGQIFKSYVFGLFWVESWGPLYAIFNYMMNIKSQSQMRAVIDAASDGATDIPLFAQAGIQAVESSIAAQAGALSMSIPFIAAIIAYGPARFAHLASSSLAVSQEAVSSTTQETTTGNLSGATTSFDSHSFHNHNGFNHNTSSHWDSDRSSVITGSGGTQTVTGDGRAVFHSAGGWSSTPTGINLGQGLTESYTEQAAASRTAAEGHSVSAGESRSALQSDVGTFASNINSNSTSGINYAATEQSSVSEDYRTVQDAARHLGQTHNVSDNEALQAVVSASVGFQAFGNGAQAKSAYEATANSSISYEDALKASQSQSVSDALQRLTTASSTENAGWSQGEGKSFSDTVEARYQEMASFDEKHDASLQEAYRYEQAAQHVSSNTAGFNQDLTQPFFEWLSVQPGSHGYAMGASQAASLLGSNELIDQGHVRDMAEKFVDQIAAGEIKGIHIPDIDNIHDQAVDKITGNADISQAHVRNTSTIPQGEDIAAHHDRNKISTAVEVSDTISEHEHDIGAGKDVVTSQSDSTAGKVGDNQDKGKPQRLIENVGSDIDEFWDALKVVNQNDGASPVSGEIWGGYYEQENDIPVSSRLGQPQKPGGW